MAAPRVLILVPTLVVVLGATMASRVADRVSMRVRTGCTGAGCLRVVGARTPVLVPGRLVTVAEPVEPSLEGVERPWTRLVSVCLVERAAMGGRCVAATGVDARDVDVALEAVRVGGRDVLGVDVACRVVPSLCVVAVDFDIADSGRVLDLGFGIGKNRSSSSESTRAD